MPNELTLWSNYADGLSSFNADQPLGPCEMHLRDGRVIELTGKTVREALALIRELGITPLDVCVTRHVVDWKR